MNGERLRDTIILYADHWRLEEEFRNWIIRDTLFCNTLVDRIVPGFPRERAEEIWQETGYRDAGTAFVSEAAGILERAGCPKPIVAIGGITLERAPEVIRAGAAAVAVISDLLSTGNPEARVRDYLRAIR